MVAKVMSNCACRYLRGGRGLVCLDVRDPPHTRRISRRAKWRTCSCDRRRCEACGVECGERGEGHVVWVML